MKKILAILSVLLFASAASFSQNDTLSNDYVTVSHDSHRVKTLIGPGMSYGGFGSFDMGMGSFNGNKYIELGGTGALVLNHAFAIGFTGAGFATPIELSETLENGLVSSSTVLGGYGGLYFEIGIKPKEPIHISFPFVLGVGGYESNTSVYTNDDGVVVYDRTNTNYVQDVFLIAKPGARVEVNVLPFFRLAAGVDYKLSDIDIDGFSNHLSYAMSLKFGHF